MTSDRFHTLFGARPRNPESLLTQKDMDLAASIQAVLEEVVLRLTRSSRPTPEWRTCASRAVLRSIALPMARSAVTARFGTFGYSRPQAMPAARSARHSRPTTSTPGNRAPCRNVLDGMSGAYLGPAFSQERHRKQAAKGRRALR